MNRLMITLVLAALALPVQSNGDVQALGPESQLNRFTTGVQTNCDVSSEMAGRYVHVWNGEDLDPSGHGIAARISGGPSEFVVNTTTTGDQTDPAVSHRSDAEFAVAWISESVPGKFFLYVRRFDAGGSPLSAEIEASDTINEKRAPAISHGADGGFVVAWLEDIGSATHVRARRYNLNGAALGPVMQIGNFSHPTTGPSVSHSSTSDFVVAWVNASNGVSAACYSQTGVNQCFLGVNDAFLFEAPTGVDVSHGPDDSFIIVYDAKWHVARRDIRGRKYAWTGATMGLEFTINANFPIDNRAPVVDHSPIGDVAVAWQSSGDLLARHIADTGVPLSSVFVVEQGMAPPGPALAWYEDRRFAFGWTQSDDVYARYYEASGQVSVGPAPRATGLTAFAQPTVFTEATNIHFELARNVDVSIRIVDLQGRAVQTLANRSFAAGAHRVRWNGDDAAGRKAAGGVYFYVVTANGERRAGRVVRVP